MYFVCENCFVREVLFPGPLARLLSPMHLLRECKLETLQQVLWLNPQYSPNALVYDSV